MSQKNLNYCCNFPIWKQHRQTVVKIRLKMNHNSVVFQQPWNVSNSSCIIMTWYLNLYKTYFSNFANKRRNLRWFKCLKSNTGLWVIIYKCFTQQKEGNSCIKISNNPSVWFLFLCLSIVWPLTNVTHTFLCFLS